MKKKSLFSRLQIQIIFACSFVILIAISVLTVFSLLQYRRLMEENTKKHAADLSSAIEAAIDSQIFEFGEFSRNAFLSDRIHEILDDSGNPEFRQKSFQDYCKSSVGYKQYLRNLYLVTKNGTVLANKGFTQYLKKDIDSCDWYHQLIDADGGMVIDYGSSWLSEVNPNREKVITVGRLMKSVTVEVVSSYHAPTGAIIFEVSPDFMKSLLSFHDFTGTEMILTDTNDQIMFDSTGKNEGNNIEDCYLGINNNANYASQNPFKSSNLFIQKEHLKYGWNLYLLFDLSELNAREAMFFRYFVVLALSILAVNLMLSALFSRNIIRPIQKIRENMKLIEDGHLNERLSGNFPSEMQGIAESYNHMMDSLENQINENYVIKLENLDSKYKVLEAQINPHFIFNVLDMINSEMILSGNTSAAKTIRSLAKHIRYNLDNSQELVTLSEEKKHLENYCNLLREVYPDFAEVKIDFPDELCDLPILSHCIQPLVENTVKHGFNGICHSGKLMIQAEKRYGCLYIDVWDNGKGIPEEKLCILQNSLKCSDHTTLNNGSIGLINIHRRFRLKFGAEYGLSIESKEKEYTKVTLVLPFLSDKA